MNETLLNANWFMTCLFVGVLFAAVVLRRDRLAPYAWAAAVILSVVIFGINLVLYNHWWAHVLNLLTVALMVLCTYRSFKNRAAANPQQ